MGKSTASHLFSASRSQGRTSFGDSRPLTDTPLLSPSDTGTNLLEVFEPYTAGIMMLVCNELPVSIFMPARQI